MVKKSSANHLRAQLADDVLFGARVLYRELDDIFGHVSGRLPPATKREGLLFARMRIVPELPGPRRSKRSSTMKIPGHSHLGRWYGTDGSISFPKGASSWRFVSRNPIVSFRRSEFSEPYS